MNTEFRYRLIRSILDGCYQYWPNNRLMLPELLPLRANSFARCRMRVKGKVLSLIKALGFARRRFDVEHACNQFLFELANMEDLEGFFLLLSDEPSRRLLIELLTFKILGSSHVKLPINTPEYWDLLRTLEKRYLIEKSTITTSSQWRLNLYDVPSGDESLRMYLHPVNILNTFLLEQYAYSVDGCCVGPREGDICIDAGGCWGDTALYLAAKIGAKGRVYSFEFVEENLAIFQKNLKLNDGLSERVRIVENALWDESNQRINFLDHGSATSLIMSDNDGSRSVVTVTIDDFVSKNSLERIDFIKMDIEGAELKALEGAEEAIKKHRPVLAITLYHRQEDYCTIPQYLANLQVGYKFYLGHFSLDDSETVLFAVADD